MPLIKSISGIRGTIGGRSGESLSPIDVVKYTAAFAQTLKNNKDKVTVVVGRDARQSGKQIRQLVSNILISLGVDVIDIGLVPTPTVQIAIKGLNSQGGIMISASHNKENWNALKLLDSHGEFLNTEEAIKVFKIADEENFEFSNIENQGEYTKDDSWISRHIEKILALQLVDVDAIKKEKLKVAVDGINSVGGIAVPKLLRALGVDEIYELNCEPTGIFSHNPEPLQKNLDDISALTKGKAADIGFAVDPDVDRLAVVDENGLMFSEEYTLVTAADYVLQHQPGNTVSNLSSSRALKDIAEKSGGKYFPSAVGEANVVEKIKKTNAVIGGEGCGGIIYPELHYGRDALVGIALILSYLAKSGISYSKIRQNYPQYFISKNQIELTSSTDIEQIFDKIIGMYGEYKINTVDGVKIDMEKEWIHLRKSNTEPIIRVYTESTSMVKAEKLAKKVMNDIKNIAKD